MSAISLTTICLLAFFVSIALTYRFSRPCSALYLLDHPNERSLHDTPVPRGGGVAILAGMMVGALGVLAVYPSMGSLWPVAVGVVLVGGISFLDERYGVAVIVRLLVHFVAAGALVSTMHPDFFGTRAVFGGALPAVVVAAVFTTLVVWAINLYNFMDGMDGFAGGMAVIGFGSLALLGWNAGEQSFTLITGAVASASAGFLVFNFPPARIFMGDVGSSSLGFVAAACALWGATEGIFPLWIALLVFAPFVVDATVTLFSRLLRREKVWQAHRTHYYQRLVQSGWSHRKTVCWEYVVMIASAGSAVWVSRESTEWQWTVIAVWALVYAILAIAADKISARTNSGGLT